MITHILVFGDSEFHVVNSHSLWVKLVIGATFTAHPDKKRKLFTLVWYAE